MSQACEETQPAPRHRSAGLVATRHSRPARFPCLCALSAGPKVASRPNRRSRKSPGQPIRRFACGHPAVVLMARTPRTKQRAAKAKKTSQRSAAPKRRSREREAHPPMSFPIVGIGASAGGLDAFQRFLSKMPADTGMAFVLVPHLDAHHKSALVDLLRPYTRMPVLEADGAKVEQDHVYIIPPNATLSIAGGALHTTTPRSRGMTIDDFFASLAQDQGENAIGIILSGTGSD